jgi:flavorubredoxin
MRFWPQKKWKQIVLITVLTFVVIVASLLGFILFKINSDYTSDLQIKNLEGTESALIIYHPGLSSFMEYTAYAFADGLIENGWRVEITTASSQAPTDLSSYSLLVLGSPVYADSPSPTIQRHVGRITQLDGIDTVLLVTSAGSDGGAEAIMQQTVEEHGGTVVDVVSLFTSEDSALELAKQAGREFVIE